MLFMKYDISIEPTFLIHGKKVPENALLANKVILVYIFYLKNTYLAAPDLSCGMWDLSVVPCGV